MDLRIDPSTGVPVYLQLMERIKHAISTGALRGGEQLPTIRALAAEVCMNPNTVARAYRDLESEGVITVRHGAGAFVTPQRAATGKAAALAEAGKAMRTAIHKSRQLALSEAEIRRVFEDELTQHSTPPAERERK